MHTAPSQHSMTTLHSGFPKRSLCDQTLAAKLFKRCRGDTNKQTNSSEHESASENTIYIFFPSQKHINYIVVLVTNPDKRRKKNKVIAKVQLCHLMAADESAGTHS